MYVNKEIGQTLITSSMSPTSPFGGQDMMIRLIEFTQTVLGEHKSTKTMSVTAFNVS